LKFTKICFQVLAILILLAIIKLNPAEARSLEIYAVEINAAVLPNGDLKVTEHRTINFHGQFKGADQKIYFNEINAFSEIIVREGAQYYTLVDQYPTIDPGTYSIRVFGEDYFMIDWSFDALDEQRTFTLEYIARDAVVVHNDVAELYYKFIGDEWEFSSGLAKVILKLPPGAEEGEVLVWGHGPGHGEVVIESPEAVSFFVAPLPAGTYLEGRVVFPNRLVPDAERTSGADALPSILREEKQWAAQANLSRFANKYQPWLSLLLIVPVGLILFFLWRRSANRGEVFRGDYYRELPGEYPPEVAGFLWHRKRIKNSFLSAGILDLARRKLLQIDVVQFAADHKKLKEDDFRLVELNNDLPRKPIDQLVLDFLFGKICDHYCEEAEKTNNDRKKEITFSQIQDFAKSRAREFQKFHHSWKQAVLKESAKQKFFEKNSSLGWGCLPILVLMVGAILVIVWWNLFILGAALFLAALIIFFGSPKLYYTKYGADQLAKWNAFRKFLLHFSKLDQSTVPSLIVWEHYLVYAVVLGVAKQVIDQLALVFPRMEQEPTFRETSWSAFDAAQTVIILNNMNRLTSSLNRTMDGAARTASATIAEASSTSSTRSSGGFSSGGGFGGGFSGGGGGGFGGGGGSFR